MSNEPSAKNYTHNANNEMTTYGVAALVFDPNGNTTQETNNSLITRYIYNTKNRLERVELPDGSIAIYTYDPFGRRVSKTVNSITTYYVYADEGLIGEYSTSGAFQKGYGWKPRGIWGTKPVFMNANNQYYYYYYYNDHLGTPQKMTDGSGNVVWSANYTAFGEAIVDPSSTITNNLRFPGQYFDIETGLHYNWQRYYDPKTGKYISKDPIGLRGGINLYAYVKNNPVNWIDPRGLIFEYHIGTGQLWHFPEGGPEGTEGAAEFVGEGFSGGSDGSNDPLYQLEENVGPIPEGTWAIGPLQTNWTVAGVELPFSMRLTPEPGTFGRGGGFIIHGGSTSQGCLLTDRTTRMRIGGSGDTRLRVVR